MKTIRFRNTLLIVLSAFALAFTVAAPVRGADVFDRISSASLRQAARASEGLTELSPKQGAEIKILGAGLTSPCIVLKTDAGNYAKAQISWGLRKGSGKPVPVLMLDRYVTYDSQRAGVALASGKNVMLFAGFTFNFDLGQVVPEGQGGDLLFTAERSLRALEGAKLYPLEPSALPPTGETATGEKATGPDLNHEGVLPQDFSGVWKVNADGRWLGTWDLAVDEKGNVSGEYLSDETKSTYKIIGKVDAEPHRMTLVVELVNAAQDYQAYLWTTDKSAMAGTTVLADQTFGFYALREQPAEAPAALIGD